MIPVQLTIKGLYSYAKAETIDFEPLVKAKLFGIFGPVGSGKSAILEAIMFVLFDRSTRLNKVGDDRYYNMMNLQSNEMLIDFIFKGGLNHRTKYRFYFLARRSTKEFNKVDVKDRSYYKWSKNDWVPMKKPEGLGMTYDNFMQTVIIPQGKFRDFIDQKPKDRTQMLKELFHLDRFDIASLAFSKLATLKEQHRFLEGQLSQYLEISKVLIKQLEKEISVLVTARGKITIREKKVSDSLRDLQVLQHQHSELKEVSQALSVLESETTFFKNKQAQLAKYLKVQDLFREKISQQQQLLLKAKTKEHELTNLAKSVQLLEKEEVDTRIKWEEAKQAFGQKEEIQRQIDDLRLLVRLKAQSIGVESASNTLVEARQEAKRLEQEMALLDQEITKLQAASTQRAEAISNLQELSELHDWWESLSEKRQRLEVLIKEQSQLEKEIQTYHGQQDRIKSKRKDQSSLRKQIQKAEEVVLRLQLQTDWSTHAQHLKDGKPCPLCGATSHPKPLSQKGLDSRLAKATDRVGKLESELETQRQLEQNLEIAVVQLKVKSDVLTSNRDKRKDISQEIQLHLEKYPGDKIPARRPTNLPKRMASTRQIIDQIEKSLTELDVKITRREELKGKQQKHAQLLESTALEHEKLIGKIDELKGMIKVLDREALLKKTEQQLQAREQQLVDKILVDERNYQLGMSNLTRVEKKLNHQKGLLQSTEAQVNEIRTQNITMESEMAGLCKKHGLKGIVEVQGILKMNLNEDQERSEIEKYRSDLLALQARQKSLRKQMGKKVYLESEHVKLEQEFHELKSSLDQMQQQISSKQHVLQQYQSQLKKKESLEQEFKEINLRKDHVQEISNLLRGNGFINFISSIYLQNLCKSANVRFQRLTNNRLSLELGDHNEFLVRDHLNEGKLRLLKTLSGGQIFQASLSLALSLAENVTQLNKAEQGFFFLDEGFGSLDRDSLQLVFESLKSLQKENRIVGIISHVEELQLEIDTYLTIEQDPEKGSLISKSWEGQQSYSI